MPSRKQVLTWVRKQENQQQKKYNALLSKSKWKEARAEWKLLDILSELVFIVETADERQKADDA